MSIKKEYQKGDLAWIYGIDVKNKLTKGTVIAILDLKSEGYTETQYVIEIPTHIEPLLEIRTWHTMSQDEKGPTGGLRDVRDMLRADAKKIGQIGFKIELNSDEDDPTPEQIMAALEKSTDGLTHKPLHIKEPTQKRRYYPRKKK